MLKGYKTYITAFGIIAFAGLGVALGYHDAAHAWELGLQAFALMGLRAGLNNAIDTSIIGKYDKK